MPPVEEPGEVTVLLERWGAGDRQAFQELMEIAYPHLRDVAAVFLRRESPDHTLQGTALVHELYLRLHHQRKIGWKDCAHFYTFAAKLMRMILTDHARASMAEKRGGARDHVPLHDDLAWVNVDSAAPLELDQALDELEALDPRKAKLVELRYFLGCSNQECASMLEVSLGTIERDLRLARSWLYARLHPEEAGNCE